MDIMDRRYVPCSSGVIDNRPPPSYPPTPRIFVREEYTATEKLDLIAWLNERDAGYPTAHVSAARTVTV